MVTRPDPQGSALCALIKAQGEEVIHFPTIAFAPPSNDVALQQAIAALGQQEWLIFISPQAVYSSIPLIRRAWPIFPSQLKLAAVGAGTAKALQDAGYVVAVYPKDEQNSEGLLAMPVFQSIKNQQIAIIRGEGGRDVITKTLTARGAHVLHVMVYQRVLPQVTIDDYLSLFKQHRISAIVCASFESVRNLQRLVGGAGWPFLKKIPLIVVSERIKILAQGLGFQPIWVARNASHDAILEVLASMRA